MGTEVLRPHDCLRPGPAPAPFPRRRASPGPNPNPPRTHRGGKRREGSPKPGKSGATGQVAMDDRAVYAGTAFWMSPAPNALPIPNFSKRRGDGGSPAGIDYLATRDIRRLLRID